jgi:SAM-dependent methyltransferase
MVDPRANFTGSVPEHYHKCLGPAWFDAFAAELARRLPAAPPGDVLEIACGTGVLTRRLRERLEARVRLVATDLSGAMLDYARGELADANGVEWREADAASLPFGDGRFGALVCGFGFMFVPDRNAALSEARRVLKEGGTLLFSVWDRREELPHAIAVAQVFEDLFPGDAEMRFNVPYDMHDPELLLKLLGQARFAEVKIEKKRLAIDRVSARSIAIGMIRGTPRSLLIEKRGVALDDAIERIAAALTRIGGADPYRSHAQAVIVEARAPKQSGETKP